MYYPGIIKALSQFSRSYGAKFSRCHTLFAVAADLKEDAGYIRKRAHYIGKDETSEHPHTLGIE
jgi:hypothetical protein